MSVFCRGLNASCEAMLSRQYCEVSLGSSQRLDATPVAIRVSVLVVRTSEWADVENFLRGDRPTR